MTGTFKRVYLADFAGDAGGRLAHPGQGQDRGGTVQAAGVTNPDVVADGMLHLEKQFPKSPQLVPELKRC